MTVFNEKRQFEFFDAFWSGSPAREASVVLKKHDQRAVTCLDAHVSAVKNNRTNYKYMTCFRVGVHCTLTRNIAFS